ncbi:hypothetical protein EW026_g2151 [Hermanssonia centrifuga]|uniref:Uncharacterized protein n=2 Tax=Hermanssonia centrifuga TaxID=98765 RepID=A0A2R6S3E2_9APHY|nr:hypothetical protein PHLCEN_2v1370 [Hermanssonia centrifuga]THH00368.1 hypothetical protein EW026_g2151 [Hermanssonia centrifuga]
MFTFTSKVAFTCLAVASASVMVAAQTQLCCQILQPFSDNASVWEDQCNAQVTDQSVLVGSRCELTSSCTIEGFWDVTCASIMGCPSQAGPVGLDCTGTQVE